MQIELLSIGLLGVLFILGVLYVLRLEGFVSGRAPLASSTNSSLPAPAQESMISRDLPGAVTSAPDQSLASTQDLIALQDAISFFHDSLKAQRDMDAATSSSKQIQGTAETVGSLTQLEKELPSQEARVKGALTDLSKNNYTVEEATRLRSLYEMGADQILTIAEGFANPSSKYKIAGPNVNAKDVQEIINKLKSIQKIITTPVLEMAISASNSTLEELKTSSTFTSNINVSTAQTLIDGGDISNMPNLFKGADAMNPTKNIWFIPIFKAISANSAKKGSPLSVKDDNKKSYTIAGPYLTANDLQELINRINATRKELVNQRSIAPSIRARIDQLEKLGADVQELRIKLVRKQIDSRDLPIEAESARKFLAGLTKSTVPPLLTPGGGSPKTAAGPAAVMQDSVVQKMLEKAKDLRWNMQISVGYDPTVQQRGQLLQKLDKVEKRLQKLSTETNSEKHEREYKTLYAELQTLTSALGGHSYSSSMGAPAGHVRPQPADSTRLPDLSTQPRSPSHANLACAQSNEFSDPYASVMTDEQIKRRASSGIASYGSVGGADYKTRVADLCRSISASGLGDSKDFGCVANPNELSPTYSWKGAHKMICNRLGDTWGGSYPEQFGCGPYDPTARFTT